VIYARPTRTASGSPPRSLRGDHHPPAASSSGCCSCSSPDSFRCCGHREAPPPPTDSSVPRLRKLSRQRWSKGPNAGSKQPSSKHRPSPGRRSATRPSLKRRSRSLSGGFAARRTTPGARWYTRRWSSARIHASHARSTPVSSAACHHQIDGPGHRYFRTADLPKLCRLLSRRPLLGSEDPRASPGSPAAVQQQSHQECGSKVIDQRRCYVVDFTK
jgi:hypothetical protein